MTLYFVLILNKLIPGMQMLNLELYVAKAGGFFYEIECKMISIKIK